MIMDSSANQLRPKTLSSSLRISDLIAAMIAAALFFQDSINSGAAAKLFLIGFPIAFVFSGVLLPVHNRSLAISRLYVFRPFFVMWLTLVLSFLLASCIGMAIGFLSLL